MSNDARCYGYARGSTSKQEATTEVQKETHKRYVEFQDLGEIIATFVDKATSGSVPLGERAAGKELLKVLRSCDHVIISKIDRMFRNLKDCVNVLDEFQRKNIKLHVCDLMGGALDLSSPMGMFLIQILAAVAQLERSYISQRTKDGLAAKKRNGVKHTRFPGYGKRWEKQKDPTTGKMVRVAVRDDEEREVMRCIVRWRLQENPFTWTEITQHLAKIGAVTKDGTPWNENRVRRSARAEFALQSREQRSLH